MRASIALVLTCLAATGWSETVSPIRNPKVSGRTFGTIELMGTVTTGAWSAVSGLTLATTNAAAGTSWTNGVTHTNYYRLSGTNAQGRLPYSTNAVIVWTDAANTNTVVVGWTQQTGLDAVIIERSHDAGATWTNWARLNPWSVDYADYGTNAWSATPWTNDLALITPSVPWTPSGTGTDLVARVSELEDLEALAFYTDGARSMAADLDHGGYNAANVRQLQLNASAYKASGIGLNPDITGMDFIFSGTYSGSNKWSTADGKWVILWGGPQWVLSSTDETPYGWQKADYGGVEGEYEPYGGLVTGTVTIAVTGIDAQTMTARDVTRWNQGVLDVSAVSGRVDQVELDYLTVSGRVDDVEALLGVPNGPLIVPIYGAILHDDDSGPMLHFDIELADSMTWSGSSFVATTNSVTGWTYWNGATMQAFPTNGLPAAYRDTEVGLVVYEATNTEQTVWARYRSWDGTDYSDYRVRRIGR